jgi:phosphoribosylaminoimidazole carboxylase (NCAIR synthetase)
MHVVFVEPAFPQNQGQFVRGLKSIGARVTGVGEAPVEALPQELIDNLYDYQHVGSVCNEDEMLHTVRRLQEREWVDRLEATVEAHILPTAKVREAAGIPGTTPRTAFLCRDKPAMKEVLREAGVACAQSAGVSSPDEARAFARAVGLPIILKPRDAAGAAGTYRIDTMEELEHGIRACGIDRGVSTAAEEFIEGHEAFYDTLSVGGWPQHEFMTHYYPGVLGALRDRTIQPYLITTNRTDAPHYDEVKAMGKRVIDALGIGTSATHMEWFFGPKGLKFSEIGCRPPGVSVWDLYCAANDLDLYAEWARAVTQGRTERQASRDYSAGMINLRPTADGTIHGYEGVDEVQAELGQWILDAHLPPPGSPTQPISGGYMVNAWIRVRHPDYDYLRELLESIGRAITVHAG